MSTTQWHAQRLCCIKKAMAALPQPQAKLSHGERFLTTQLSEPFQDGCSHIELHTCLSKVLALTFSPSFFEAIHCGLNQRSTVITAPIFPKARQKRRHASMAAFRSAKAIPLRI
ncbi:hypothetical protein E8K88_06065 [Lampropedia aestuarii]|uniref:Uncharacterized protein n=1 Tax=Lampropedia aestuarii TaxID=2562762 RepID=A0A4S5BU76_9BURK|nr:hypothetical protein [Lampropedia aestuarii]THJ34555.1 hypothetical protein E8K88_06065 [Lampropedia aestuarii]